jgi:hypothetical protein
MFTNNITLILTVKAIEAMMMMMIIMYSYRKPQGKEEK